MKNLKIVLTSMLLVAGVIAFSSFNSNNYNSKIFDDVSFKYVPTTNDDIQVQNSYSTTAVTCTGGTIVCKITFDDAYLDNGKPNSFILGLVSSHINDTKVDGKVTVTLADETQLVIEFKPAP